MADPHTTEMGDFERSPKRSQYKKNCSEGYTQKGYYEVHHILCVSSLADSKITEGDIDYIKKCFGVTRWNINDAKNLIGLPTKRPYKYKPNDKAWDKLPCHKIDHNPHYTEGVTQDLNDSVWAKLKKKKAGCDVKGKDVADALDAVSEDWKNFLLTRGQEHGGTRACWQMRNEPHMEDKWHIPFSMHPGVPPPRRPIPDPPPALRALFKRL